MDFLSSKTLEFGGIAFFVTYLWGVIFCRVLSQPSQPVTETNVDPVVRMPVAVFRLCEMETRALDARLHCSPEVSDKSIPFWPMTISKNSMLI